jgi:hypothetical protein
MPVTSGPLRPPGSRRCHRKRSCHRRFPSLSVSSARATVSFLLDSASPFPVHPGAVGGHRRRRRGSPELPPEPRCQASAVRLHHPLLPSASLTPLMLALPTSPHGSRRRAAAGRATTRRQCTVTALRRAQRVGLAWANRVPLATGPGRCCEALGQNRPSAISILFPILFFIFNFLKSVKLQKFVKK